MRVLVTGAAGFVGSAVCRRLIARGDEVVGIDNLNDYYDVNLKKARLELVSTAPSFNFHQVDISDAPAMSTLFKDVLPDKVVNLAAQAGVRHSLSHPHTYLRSNIDGFLNILEGCRHNGVKALVYASSGSVYGGNKKLPFSIHEGVDHPVSLYGATKRANELMAHSYSHLYQIPTAGLRFFSVYGPWGRPDMALFIFTKKILADETIDVYNHGDHLRDFTYIDDIVEGIVRVLDNPILADPAFKPEDPDPARSNAPYRIYNIGNNAPVRLMDMITALEKLLGKQATKNYLGLQPGDVPQAIAEVDDLIRDYDFKPKTSFWDGMARFVEWYLNYYHGKVLDTSRQKPVSGAFDSATQ